jgi:hypothetical protein
MGGGIAPWAVPEARHLEVDVEPQFCGADGRRDLHRDARIDVIGEVLLRLAADPTVGRDLRGRLLVLRLDLGEAVVDHQHGGDVQHVGLALLLEQIDQDRQREIVSVEDAGGDPGRAVGHLDVRDAVAVRVLQSGEPEARQPEASVLARGRDVRETELDADVEEIATGELDQRRLDQHLGLALVEPHDETLELLVARGARSDQERIRLLVGNDHELGAPIGAARSRLSASSLRAARHSLLGLHAGGVLEEIVEDLGEVSAPFSRL